MARWDDPVQHYRLSLVVSLDRPARLFLCVGCRVQVVLCSRCDRGNRYCSRACWRQKRDLARREAACRYQRSRGGRIRHAARSQCWRERIALRAVQGGNDDVAGAVGLGSEHKVTHQGSLPGVAADPLGACTNDTDIFAPATGAPASPPWRRCCRCAALQPDWLRQGFLRHATRAKSAPGWRRDRSP